MRATFFSVLFLIVIAPAPATLQQPTLDAWNSYIETTEKRIDDEAATASVAMAATAAAAAVAGHHIEDQQCHGDYRTHVAG